MNGYEDISLNNTLLFVCGLKNESEITSVLFMS